jgi:hypothetical protein
MGISGLLRCRVNRERTLTEVCGKGRVVPRMTLKRQFAPFEKDDKPAFDVLATTLDHRLAAHNPRSWQRWVAHREEVADSGVFARYEMGRVQQLLDLVRRHVRPKERAHYLTFELNE